MRKDRVKLINFNDNRWNCNVLNDIITKTERYITEMGYSEAELVSIEDNSWEDKENCRYDIEIQFMSGKRLVRQKLLLLKGELLDGKTFHKRFGEFYNV